MARNLTLCLHADALRHDYVTEADMPFLASLGELGVTARLIPTFGFEPDGAYLTGTYPEIYEGGMHFVLAEAGSSIPFARVLPGIFDRLNVYLQYPLRKGLEWLIGRFGSTDRIRRQPFVGQIPFRLLRAFDFCEKHHAFEPGFADNVPTLFDHLRRARRSFYYHGYPSHRCDAESVRRRFLHEFDGRADLVFLLIGNLDEVGHTHGPQSLQRRAAASQVDQALREIYQHAQRFYDKVDLIVFGDHGMVEVTDYLNARPIVEQARRTLGEDFTYFLDSTFIRFWVDSRSGREMLTAQLRTIQQGRVITDGDREVYRIRYQNRKFGDVVFWVNEGVMVFPNFWHARNKKKGMHGYRREVADNHAAFVFHSTHLPAPARLDSIEMVDVFQTAYFSLFGHSARFESVWGTPVQERVDGVAVTG